EREELLADERLERRGVVRAAAAAGPVRGERGELRAHRDERLPRAGGRREDDVRARDQLDERLALVRVELEALLGRPRGEPLVERVRVGNPARRCGHVGEESRGAAGGGGHGTSLSGVGRAGGRSAGWTAPGGRRAARCSVSPQVTPARRWPRTARRDEGSGDGRQRCQRVRGYAASHRRPLIPRRRGGKGRTTCAPTARRRSAASP